MFGKPSGIVLPLGLRETRDLGHLPGQGCKEQLGLVLKPIMKSETTVDSVFRKEESQMGRFYLPGRFCSSTVCIVYVLLWADRTPEVLPTSSGTF